MRCVKKIKNSCRSVVIMVSLKHNFLRSIATKKLPAAVTKGAKRGGNFTLQHLKYPAVGNFIQDQAGMMAATGFNTKLAAPAMAE